MLHPQRHVRASPDGTDLASPVRPQAYASPVRPQVPRNHPGPNQNPSGDLVRMGARGSGRCRMCLRAPN